jgi:deoxyribose-phosphate aldolase
MNLSTFIDHTLLAPTADEEQVVEICQETKRLGFASACLHPFWIAPMASRFPDTRLCTVIAFPLGLQTTGLYEAERAVLAGALELDIVVNPALVSRADWLLIEEDLLRYRRIFAEITLKLIIESCQRSDEEIIRLTELCSDTGFDFIKTSTGFAREGASLHAVALMKTHARAGLRIKASGGIKTLDQALAMIKAGAARVGTSSGASILAEWDAREKLARS